MSACSKALASLGFLAGSVILSVNDVHAETRFTAGVALEKMQKREFISYVAGIVEGLAYARYRKDNVAGSTDASGMSCIYDWYYGDDSVILTVQDAFKRYPDHFPSNIIAVMIKRKCGE